MIQEFEDKIDQLTYKATNPNAVYSLLLTLYPDVIIQDEDEIKKS